MGARGRPRRLRPCWRWRAPRVIAGDEATESSYSDDRTDGSDRLHPRAHAWVNLPRPHGVVFTSAPPSPSPRGLRPPSSTESPSVHASSFHQGESRTDSERGHMTALLGDIDVAALVDAQK